MAGKPFVVESVEEKERERAPQPPFITSTLQQAANQRLSYTAKRTMIGSKTKREQVYAALRSQGVPDAELAAVCCPIGLTIKAETPQQIAVSIVAELLASRAGTLVRLRFDD